MDELIYDGFPSSSEIGKEVLRTVESLLIVGRMSLLQGSMPQWTLVSKSLCSWKYFPSDLDIYLLWYVFLMISALFA